MRPIPTHLLLLPLLTLSTSTGQAQGRYSQATYITPKQFLAQLKEVSLYLITDSSLTRMVPLAEQRDAVDRALAVYGITVRPNSPVSIEVRVTHTRDTFQLINNDTGRHDGDRVIQVIFVGVKFFVKAAAWRHGRLHWVMAAPAVGWAGSTQEQDDDNFRKLLLGDQTRQNLKRRFGELFAESLKSVAEETTGEDKPWSVNAWTAAAKAAVDAAYAAQRSTADVDVTALQDVNSMPELSLEPVFDNSSCKADPGWSNAWTRGFEGLHWTDTKGPNNLFLGHQFSCGYAEASRYFSLADRINLSERNLVFELNGKLFRRWGVIFSTHHEILAVDEDIAQRSPAFLPQSIEAALQDLEIHQIAAGDPNDEPLPAAADATPLHAPGAIPHPLDHGTLNTMFRGKKVVSWNNESDRRWYYEDGSPVEQAYQLDGVAASPLFDYRPRPGGKISQAETTRLVPLLTALHDEVARYRGGELTGEGQYADLLQHDPPSMTCIVREYANDLGTVHFCANLQALDLDHAEVSDRHLTIPCRDSVPCEISAGSGGSMDATRAVILGDQRLSASLGTALSIWTTSSESGQTILGLLKEYEGLFAKLTEPAPVVPVP